jgi:hypothetical protein
MMFYAYSRIVPEIDYNKSLGGGPIPHRTVREKFDANECDFVE